MDKIVFAYNPLAFTVHKFNVFARPWFWILVVAIAGAIIYSAAKANEVEDD